MLILPLQVLTDESKDVIRRLVVVQPHARTGAQTPGNYTDLLDHPFFRGTSDQTLVACAIPSLGDLCVRALVKAIADKAVRPRKLTMLSWPSYHRMRHMLSRLKRLHEPRVLRMFWDASEDARCLRALTSTREFIGLEYDVQGHWSDPFVFVNIALVPDLKVEDDASADAVAASVKRVVSSMNRLRPKFCCLYLPTGSADASLLIPRLRAAVSRISESIPLAFVQSHSPVSGPMESPFGADYLGFWFSGMRCLVLNSALLLQPKDARTPSHAAQEAWFDEEVEQGQLGGHHVCVFTFHQWFANSVDEEDNGDGGVLAKHTRLQWIRKFFSGKVRAVFYSGISPQGRVDKIDRRDFEAAAKAYVTAESSSVLRAGGAVVQDLGATLAADQTEQQHERTEKPERGANGDGDEEEEEEEQTEEHSIEFVRVPCMLHSAGPAKVGIVEAFESSLRHSFHVVGELPCREDLAQSLSS